VGYYRDMNSENLTIRTDPETKKRWIQLMDFLKEKTCLRSKKLVFERLVKYLEKQAEKKRFIKRIATDDK